MTYLGAFKFLYQGGALENFLDASMDDFAS